MAMSCVAAKGNGLLVFIDDVTLDRGGYMEYTMFQWPSQSPDVNPIKQLFTD